MRRDAAHHRQQKPEQVIPRQKISVEEEVRAYTVGSAYAEFRAGKVADMVLLERDIFEIDPVGIEDVHVALTVMDGKVVYSSSAVRKK